MMRKQHRTSEERIRTITNQIDDPPEEVGRAYASISKKLKIVKHLDKVTYEAPVNFNESLEAPRHRWFPYKEGFSPSFVRSFLDQHRVPDLGRVLDPFAGVGTTIIEASLTGRTGVGIEISPLAAFIARTKSLCLTSHERELLRQEVVRFSNSRLTDVSAPPSNTTVCSYFEPAFLESLLRVKAYISNLVYPIQDLFRLAFLRLIEPFSTHRKAGNGQKKRTRLLYNSSESAIDQIRGDMVNSLNLFQKDIELSQTSNRFELLEDSCLELDKLVEKNSCDAMLTSPPYANCFDYSKIYMCELWLGDFFRSRTDQCKFRANSVRSHVHARWENRFDLYGSPTINDIVFPLLSSQKLWSSAIPNMLRGYFMDLGRMLFGLNSVLKKDSPAGIVVSNSVYGGIPIATDLLVAEIAMRHGFEVCEIQVYRHMVPSSQQFVRVRDKELFRESMVVIRK
jgi:hypothetical protein